MHVHVREFAAFISSYKSISGLQMKQIKLKGGTFSGNTATEWTNEGERVSIVLNSPFSNDT